MDWIASMLPKGVKVERDAKNDVWFTAGSGKPHILFVAHATSWHDRGQVHPAGDGPSARPGGFLAQSCEARRS